MLALLLLVHAFKSADPPRRERIYRTYLSHTAFINSWDLVDASAEHIVGSFVSPDALDPLLLLARSDSVWERRIAILSTFGFIRRGVFGPTLRVAELLVRDRHDLIHKAVGWMLREVGNRDRAAEEAFLCRHLDTMPRTMLRYAIERFPEPLRGRYLAGVATSTPT